MVVEELARRLREKEGVHARLDKWNLIPGASWQPAIEDVFTKSFGFQGRKCLATFAALNGLG